MSGRTRRFATLEKEKEKEKKKKKKKSIELCVFYSILYLTTIYSYTDLFKKEIFVRFFFFFFFFSLHFKEE